jgi:hypothetical protein
LASGRLRLNLQHGRRQTTFGPACFTTWVTTLCMRRCPVLYAMWASASRSQLGLQAKTEAAPTYALKDRLPDKCTKTACATLLVPRTCADCAKPIKTAPPKHLCRPGYTTFHYHCISFVARGLCSPHIFGSCHTSF